MVPGEVALQSRLFRVHTHNNLLKNDRRFRTARAHRVQTIILGQEWVEPSRRTLLTTKISEEYGVADYHPDRRRVGTVLDTYPLDTLPFHFSRNFELT